MKTPTPEAGKRVLVFALCGFCLVVWGYVVYRIERGLDAPAVPPSAQVLPLPDVPAPVPPAPRYRDDAWPSVAHVRDPFRMPPGVLDPPRPPPRIVTPRPPAPPSLTLGGIVGHTALLQDDDGAVYVARAGETAGPARILRVRTSHAVVRYEGHTFTLSLSPENPR